jgi:hypothetical protein
VFIRVVPRAALLTVAALCAQAAPAAPAGFAGLWFQCQPRWAAEKNYLLVDVKSGERSWDAQWGAEDSARGAASRDAEGNLALRGCHAHKGTASKACDPAKPPLFATLPRAATEGARPPVDAALRRGAWIPTDRAGTEQLARQCAALRPPARPKP